MEPNLQKPSRWRRTRRVLVSLFGAFVVAYVAWPSILDALDEPRDPHQNKCVPRGPDPGNAARPNPGTVKVIHLTNSGEFVDRCELTDALYEMVWDRELQGPNDYGPPPRRDARKLPRLAILYVHGWKHSADPDDTDLDRFRKLIGRLNTQRGRDKQVFGVYVGWHADWHLKVLDQSYLGVLQNLTFWSKKTVADRIAESGVVTKIVSALGAARKPDRGDQLIAIGHSFGARLLFAATGQTLIYETERAHPGSPVGIYRIVKSATDAVVLLNPAFEASMYTALDDVTRNEERFAPDQAPLLVSISSVGDYATRVAFPVGQWLAGARSELELTTLGNYDAYFSHTLEPTDGQDCDGNGTPISEVFAMEGLCLKRSVRPIRMSYNPFVVAHTLSSSIIRDHNDIWNDRISNWMLGLVEALEARHDISNKAAKAAAEASR